MRLSALLISVLFVVRPLAAEIPLRGHVTDESGAALQGARVELYPASTAFERDLRVCCGAENPLPLDVRHSGADGIFVLSAPEPGLFEVVIRDRGKLALGRTVGPVVEATDLESAALGRTIAVRVRVVDPQERPVPGARVRARFLGVMGLPFALSAVDVWQARDRVATTDENGTAVLRVGENEAAGLSAFFPGSLVVQEDRLVLLTEKTLRLESGTERTLEVRDPASEPVAGALVRLDSTPIGLTGEDGRLTVTTPAKGRFFLSAETASGHYAELSVEAPDEDEGPTVLALREPELLSGRVTDASTARPLADAWVAAGESVARTAGDGTFLLALRKTRRPLEVRALAPGHLPRASQVSDGQGDWASHHDLALAPWAELRGLVVDEADVPISGAEVVLLEAAPGHDLSSYYAAAGRAFVQRPFTRSGGDGRILFHASPGEDYELEVTKPGYLPALAEARAGTGEPLRVVLRRSRSGFGLVLDLDEQPVAGAAVRLWPAPRNEDGRRDSASWQATTDEEGRFELREIRPGPSFLRVTAAGFAPLAVEGLSVVFEPGEEAVDLGTILLERGVRVAGRVVDPRDRPIAKVKVAWELWSTKGDLKPWELETTEVTTDEEGRFAIGDLLVGEKLDLTAWHIDYATSEAKGVECPAEDLVIVLEPTAAVRGRVVGPGGAPVKGARVYGYHQALNGGRLTQDTTTREDGSFEMSYLGSRGVELEASARGLGTRRLWLDLEPGEVVEGVVFELEAGAVIEGTVLGPSGVPVAGARVSRHREGARFEGFSEVTDAAGRFRLGGLDPGPVPIYVLPHELPPASRSIDVVPGVNPVEIRLEEGFQVHGRVVDGDGVPVPSARVDFADGAESTQEDGAFAFENVARGVHRLAVTKRGFAPREIPDVKVDGAVWDLEIVLHRGGVVTGLVLGLEPSSLGRLRVWASSLEDQWAESRVDYGGRYRLGPLAPGKWRVEAIDAANGRTARGSVELEAGAAEAELDLEFVPGLAVTGEVYLDGRPEAGGTVRLQGLDSVSGGRARVDYAGTFRFENLGPGRYRIVVRGAQGSVLEVREIELASDEHVVFELSTVELRGRTLDAADARPLAGAEVTLAPSGSERGGETLRASTDSDGRFRFPRLAEGSYRLRAEKEGYALYERRMEVEAGAAPDEPDLGLERTSGVVLDVRDAAGGLPEVVWAAAFAGTAVVGEPVVAGRFLVTGEGTARLTSLPPGTWTIVAATPGSAAVEITASAPGHVVPVRLPPETRLEITVPELVGGTELATVTLEGAEGSFVSVGVGGLRRQWPLRGGWTVIEGLPPGSWTVSVAGKARTWTGRATASTDGGSVRLSLD